MKRHSHSVTKLEGPKGFVYCVAGGGSRCSPGSHGGAMFIARCRCGAFQERNRNQGHEERGWWVTPLAATAPARVKP